MYHVCDDSCHWFIVRESVIEAKTSTMSEDDLRIYCQERVGFDNAEINKLMSR